MFEKLVFHATHWPDKNAVCFLGDGETLTSKLTYRELLLKVTAVANFVVGRTSVGDRVLLLYPSGIDFIVAFLGSISAGRIAVPAYMPREKRSAARLENVISNAIPSLVLTSSTSCERVEAALRRHECSIPLTSSDEIQSTVSSDWIAPDIEGEDIAFLQYTSGSTASAKGVQVTHRNLIANQEKIKQIFEQDSDSVVVSWLPFYHDMGLIGSILHPLYLGATSVLMPAASFLEKPVRWLRAVSKYNGTISGGPNFAYDLCCDKISNDELKNINLSRWEVAFSGAEKVRERTMRRFAERFREVGFKFNAFSPCYGLAEATLMVGGIRKSESLSFAELDQKSMSYGRDVACGLAVDTEVRIVGENQQCLPEGGEGLIWVAGESVASGYWRAECQSSETFNCFLGSGAGPFLNTGDIGYLKNGQLYVSGRQKDMLIVRGANYYPEDIEELVLSSCKLFDSCRAAAFAIDEQGEEQLVIVAEAPYERETDYDKIFKQVLLVLAEESQPQPTEIVLIRRGTIPRTSSGKVQRFLCRQAYLDDSGLRIFRRWSRGSSSRQSARNQNQAEYCPSNSLEEQVKAIVQEVVDATQIGVSENLFSYGLDSLGVASIVSEIKEGIGVDFSADLVFQTPSIRGIAKALTQEKATDDDNPITKTSDRIVPLSPVQQSMWLDIAISGQSRNYNIPVVIDVEEDFCISLKDELLISIVENQFNNLIEEHGALRTVVEMKEGIPYQHVLSSYRLNLELVRLADDDEFEEAANRDAGREFSLEEGPLFSVSLYKLGNGRQKLVAVFHHLIADGYSIGLILRSLHESLAREQAGSVHRKSNASLQYKDFAAWQNRMLSGSSSANAREFWKEQISQISAPKLPGDQTLLASASNRSGGSLELHISKAVAAQVEQIAKELEVTVYVVFLACYFVLLKKLTGQSRLSIGIYSSGRNRDSLMHMVGPVVCPILMNVEAKGTATFNSFVRKVAKKLNVLYSYQFVPFYAYAVSQEVKSNCESIYPRVFFNGLDVIPTLSRDQNVLKMFRKMPSVGTNYDLNSYLTRGEEGYILRMDYQLSRFSNETVRFWADGFSKIVEQCLSIETLCGDFRLDRAKKRLVKF